MPNPTPHYAGSAFADLLRHDGGLPHAVGASSYQVLRANRTHPQWAEDLGNTYNHGPMLTFWRGRFYLEYLSTPVDEHIGPGCSLLAASEDGTRWGKPQVCFPEITIPAGRYACSDGTVIEVPEDKPGFMHQRMGFFHTKDDRLLVSGFYGHAPHHDICPWQHFGMGRVVRELFEDGAMGEIYFIRYLDYSGWTEEKLPFPYYKRSSDPAFVAACEELLADRLVTQQWREEHGWQDDTIGVDMPRVGLPQGVAENSPFESSSSFCWYTIDEKTVMGLWKQGKVGRSDDGGKSFTLRYEPSFVTSGAKSWGQKTDDGRYAIAYVNSLSSEHRYPLVAVTSGDGIQFDGMACLCGEVPPRRYEGIYKDFGPQYIRGISEGHAEYPAGAFWLCHSMNKEDIFVTRVPVPVRLAVNEHIHDTFEHLNDWNIYSTKWSPVSPYLMYGTQPCMRIADKDPCDYARAMRIFPKAKQISVSLDIMAAGQYEEALEIEIADGKGTPACWAALGNGLLRVKYGANTENAFEIPAPPAWHTLEFKIDCAGNTYAVAFDGAEFTYGLSRLVHKVNEVERLVIRTKPRRHSPNYDDYPEGPDIPGTDTPVNERIYFVKGVTTEPSE